MRIFPRLQFFVDEGLEKQLKICELLAKVTPQKEVKNPDDDSAL